jgi:hypothetical protein
VASAVEAIDHVLSTTSFRDEVQQAPKVAVLASGPSSLVAAAIHSTPSARRAAAIEPPASISSRLGGGLDFAVKPRRSAGGSLAFSQD